MTADPSPRQRRLRTDAKVNRERILDACEEHFAQNGLDAPLIGVIRALNIGNGTLYRHFENQDAILAALYDRLIARLDDLVVRSKQSASGWDAMLLYIDEVTAMLDRHPYTLHLLGRVRSLLPDDRRGAQFIAPMQRIVESAIAEGHVRADFTATDLALVPYTLFSATIPFPSSLHGELRARLRTLILDGVTRADGTPLGTLQATSDELDRAVHRQIH